MHASAQPGLVVQVTSVSTAQFSLAMGLRDLNGRRRIRRMRRVAIASAEGARDWLTIGGGRFSCVLVTLTYRPGAKWEGRQVADYIKATNTYAAEQGVRLRYQWVMELTQAGVPHYHVLWWGPHGFRIPKPDASGSWPHGLSQVARARSGVGYLVKYATKGGTDYHEIPKGARLFGVGGGSKEEKHKTHRAGLPAWLLERLPNDARGRRVARLGWVCTATGVIHRSPFRVGWHRDSFGIIVITIERIES